MGSAQRKIDALHLLFFLLAYLCTYFTYPLSKMDDDTCFVGEQNYT